MRATEQAGGVHKDIELSRVGGGLRAMRLLLALALVAVAIAGAAAFFGAAFLGAVED